MTSKNLSTSLGAILMALTMSYTAPTVAQNLLSQIQLPQQYTIVYKVKAIDTATPASLQDTIAAIRRSVQKDVNSHGITAAEGNEQITYRTGHARDEFRRAEVRSNREYLVTVSSDGSHFLCYIQNQKKVLQTASIYSAHDKVTYLYTNGNAGLDWGVYPQPGTTSQLIVDPGFNQSSAFLLPLLWYDHSWMGLYFFQGDQLESGFQARPAIWRGQSFLSINQYAVVQQPMYSSAQCVTTGTGRTTWVERCTVYNFGVATDDWQYLQPVNFQNTRLPQRIIFNSFKPGGSPDQPKAYPAERFIYTLERAVPQAAADQKFTIENWMPEGQPVAVQNSGIVPKTETMEFTYVPGVRSLKDAIALEITGPPGSSSVNGGLNHWLPYIVVGFLMICLGGWMIRRQHLNRALRRD